MTKVAPISRKSGIMGYNCSYEVSLGHHEEKSTIVTVPVSTVCPCSLEISETGAHNQRAEVYVRLTQRINDPRSIWLEDIIGTIEESTSSDVYSVLKRPDEKFVTEKMFRNPMFTEDVVREVVTKLQRDIPDACYRVWCESLESIHGHNAHAEVIGPSNLTDNCGR
jgi:GTP cyclohydrolase I